MIFIPYWYAFLANQEVSFSVESGEQSLLGGVNNLESNSGGGKEIGKVCL